LSSLYCEKAIEDALQHGNALLKFISRNNVGLTGSHECGFYLPKSVWQMFAPFPPSKGRLDKHDVTITWQDGRLTDSVVTWYGKKTRSEYRLTRFGKDFPFLNEDVVGNLLVLIATSPDEFLAYVLDLDEDIEDIQAALGVDAFDRWGVYRVGAPQPEENEPVCVDRFIQKFSAGLTDFPANTVFSSTTRELLAKCVKGFANLSPDKALVRSYSTEYQLFRAVERQVCQNDVSRLFQNIDDFLKVAASIMNRRKSRAGRSFENHVENLLKTAGVPHEMRPDLGADGAPDIVIPSAKAYFDETYPMNRVFIVGLKTTCKDRWRQVTQEGVKVERKYLITMQEGITKQQLAQMEAAKVSLVVPQPLHRYYPNGRTRPLTVENFVETAKRMTKGD
jgi:EcoRII C terminal/Restriction endonuclease EcoRII, N-terminal